MNPHLPATLLSASTGAELYARDGRSLPLVASTLRAVAQGGIARLVLEQQFVNSFDDTLHVTYRMPLPAEGAVSGYAFEIAGRVIKGVVDKKAAARERFERAIASGQTAALLEQERADIFTQKLGNIPPRESITARITIDMRLAWLPEGEWELRFPTVIGPRYCGTAEAISDARATHVKTSTEDIGVRLSIELAIKDAIADGRTASSPSHELAAMESGAVALSTGMRLDRDLVVRWPVAKQEVGISLAASRHGAAAYGLVSIVPPAPTAKVAPVPRDLLVLLDTSGSMGGGPLDKAKQVVAMMIDSLGETDRLEMIEFSTRTSRYRAEPVLATAKAKAAAIAWVRSREADGGTEMRAAVLEALQTLRIGAQRQVLVVTDGYVGGEQQILRVLHEQLPASCRLHVLGVGSAVNRSLATSLARAGRGAEVIVGIDEDAERGAKRLLDRTRAPMLTNVEIAGSALVQHVPEHVPDVFAGAPLLAALELRPEGGEIVVRGQLAHESWEQRIRVPAVGEGSSAIAALFGRERVADLEARSTMEQVNDEIESIGIHFQIATRLTSWIAVDERVSVEPSAKTRTEVVPQELPYGTRAEAFGLRASQSPAMSTRAGGMRTQSGVVKEMDFDGYAEGAPPSEESFDEPTGAGAPPSAARARVATNAPAEKKREAAEDKAPAGPRKTMMVGSARAPSSDEPAKPSTVSSMHSVQPMPVAKPAPEPVPEMPRAAAKRARQARSRMLALFALLAAAIAAIVWLLTH